VPGRGLSARHPAASSAHNERSVQALTVPNLPIVLSSTPSASGSQVGDNRDDSGCRRSKRSRDGTTVPLYCSAAVPSQRVCLIRLPRSLWANGIPSESAEKSSRSFQATWSTREGRSTVEQRIDQKESYNRGDV